MPRPLGMTSRTSPLDWPNREAAPLARNVENQETAMGTVSSGTHHIGQLPDFLYPHSHETREWISDLATVSSRVSMTVFAVAKSKQKEELHLMLTF